MEGKNQKIEYQKVVRKRNKSVMFRKSSETQTLEGHRRDKKKNNDEKLMPKYIIKKKFKNRILEKRKKKMKKAELNEFKRAINGGLDIKGDTLFQSDNTRYSQKHFHVELFPLKRFCGNLGWCSQNCFSRQLVFVAFDTCDQLKFTDMTIV